MTPDAERLAAIRARVEKATEGPWRWYEDEDGCRQFWIQVEDPGDARYIGLASVEDEVEPGEPADDSYAKGNADFIAHARSDIPWLLDLIDTLLPPPGSPRGEDG